MNQINKQLAQRQFQQSKGIYERRYHILQCVHKTCKDMLYKHVQTFYHKDGNLDIQVKPFSKQK